VKTVVDLTLYGYETRPIAKALAHTIDPFIPGLSGREDACVGFLKNIGVKLESEGKWRTPRDLTKEEKQRLFSKIAKHLVHEGLNPDIVYQLIGTIYIFLREEFWTPLREGREYAALLNACARMGKHGLGIAICLGDRGSAFEEAQRIFNEYRVKIAKSFEWVREEKAVLELKNIYALRAGENIDNRIIGVVASILVSSGALEKDKPVIATSKAEEGLLKVSARASDNLVEKGLNLGKIMIEAAKKYSGRGGGHNIAAGAFIPEEAEEKFLETIDELVGAQISPVGEGEGQD